MRSPGLNIDFPVPFPSAVNARSAQTVLLGVAVGVIVGVLVAVGVGVIVGVSDGVGVGPVTVKSDDRVAVLPL